MFLKSKKKFWLAGGTAPYYAGSSAGGDAAATTAFLARVTAASLTIDSTHATMYRNLINGLVSDGLISGATPKLDALYFFATNTVTGPNTALALMSLVSSTFNATVSGVPTFTADQGYASTDNASNKAVNSNFNPSTAGGHYQQNSAHVSLWANNNVTAVSGGIAIGCNTAAGTGTAIFPKYSNGNAYWRINDALPASGGITMASSIGHYVANRSAASGTTSSQGYKNAVDQGVTAVSSGALTNQPMGICANSASSSFGTASACQISCASIGGSLTPTQVTALYNRLAAARSAVGL